MFSGGKTTLDEARELVSDAELWPRVRDFLWDFAPQVHESWLEDVCGRETMDPGREVGSSLVSSLSSSPRVKRFVLDKLGVEPFFFDFPRGDWSRLALLDGAALLEIAGWLGALACADDLRRVTDGTTVRELKAYMPWRSRQKIRNQTEFPMSFVKAPTYPYRRLRALPPCSRAF